VPYCGSAPIPAEWLTRWNFDPVLLAAMALGAYIWRTRWRSDASQDRPALAALGIAVFLFISPFCALSSALFTARVVHDVILAAFLAPLIAAALPRGLANSPGSLPVWTAIHVLIFWGWHAPPLYSAALSADAVFWLMQISITGSAAVWWAKLLRAPAAASVAALLAGMVAMGLLGALLTFAGQALYPPHWLTTQAWGLSPLADQQIAGIIMWAPASAIYLLAAMAILYRSLGKAERAR